MPSFNVYQRSKHPTAFTIPGCQSVMFNLTNTLTINESEGEMATAPPPTPLTIFGVSSPSTSICFAFFLPIKIPAADPSSTTKKRRFQMYVSASVLDSVCTFSRSSEVSAFLDTLRGWASTTGCFAISILKCWAEKSGRASKRKQKN